MVSCFGCRSSYPENLPLRINDKNHSLRQLEQFTIAFLRRNTWKINSQRI
nr:MAG TPA: hypothetical protein [Caudoviricetes sp.]